MKNESDLTERPIVLTWSQTNPLTEAVWEISAHGSTPPKFITLSSKGGGISNCRSQPEFTRTPTVVQRAWTLCNAHSKGRTSLNQGRNRQVIVPRTRRRRKLYLYIYTLDWLATQTMEFGKFGVHASRIPGVAWIHLFKENKPENDTSLDGAKTVATKGIISKE